MEDTYLTGAGGGRWGRWGSARGRVGATAGHWYPGLRGLVYPL